MKLEDLKKFIISVLFCLSFTSALPVSLYWNKGRGYAPFKHASDEGIIIENLSDTLIYDYYPLPNPSETFSLNFRSKNINGNPSKNYYYFNKSGKRVHIRNPHWGFFITSLTDTLAINVKNGEKITATEPEPTLDVMAYNLKNGDKLKASLTDKINPYSGENLWTVNVEDGILTVTGGDRGLSPILSIKCGEDITGFGFYAGWGDKITISDISIEFIEKKQIENLVAGDNIDDYINGSEDQMEGYWTLFDRDLEEALLKFGGIYTLLCLKDGEEGYSMLYMEGASVNSTNWTKGDIKARLKPTSFEGIYDVEWIDAMKTPLKKDIKAQIGEGETLIFQFPYQSSKFRLRKIP